MAYIMNKSDGDFQQGDRLYKPNRGIIWTPKYSWISDRSQKSRPVNFWKWYCGNYLLIGRAIDRQ